MDGASELANELQRLHSAYARLVEENDHLRRNGDAQLAELHRENEALRQRLRSKLQSSAPPAPAPAPPAPSAARAPRPPPEPASSRELRKLRDENRALAKELHKVQSELRQSESAARELRVELRHESAASGEAVSGAYERLISAALDSLAAEQRRGLHPSLGCRQEAVATRLRLKLIGIEPGLMIAIAALKLGGFNKNQWSGGNG